MGKGVGQDSWEERFFFSLRVFDRVGILSWNQNGDI